MKVHCPNCKKEIDSSVDTCEHCGFSMSNYRSMLLENKVEEGEKLKNKEEILSIMYDTGKIGMILMYVLTIIFAIITVALYFESTRKVSEDFSIMVLQPTIYAGISCICTVILLVAAVILQVLRNIHMKKTIMLDILIKQTKK